MKKQQNSQAKNKYPIKLIVEPKKIIGSIASLNRSQRETLGILAWHQYNFGIGNVEIGQTAIGRAHSKQLRRQQVNVHIGLFKKLGLVATISRYKRASLSYISPLIYNELRTSIIKYIPGLKNILDCSMREYCSILIFVSSLLLSNPALVASKLNQTQELDINNLYININRTPVPQTMEYGNKERLRELLVATRLTMGSHRSEYNPSKYHPALNEPEFKRSSMSTIKHPDPFGETINRLGQELKLTLWGKIKLIPFSDNVLLHAYKELQKEKEPIESPVPWLFSLCLRVTRELKKEPNWNKYNDIAALYNMPKDPLLSESYIPTKGKIERSSTTPKPSAYKPYKPESRPELPVIIEYVKFQRHANSPLGKQNKEWTSTNPFRRRLLDYFEQNPSEIIAFKKQYPDMWTSLVGEEPCNTSSWDLLSPDLFRFE